MNEETIDEQLEHLEELKERYRGAWVKGTQKRRETKSGEEQIK